MWVFYNGKILDLENVTISPFDRAFQFGDGVYEVIRYYPEKFFEYDSHLDRLKSSLKKLEISFTAFVNIESILYELIRKNNLDDQLSIAYIQISRGVQFPRRHYFDDGMEPTVFMYVEKFPARQEEMKSGVKAGLEEDIRWMRCDIKTTSLLPNVLSKQRAVKNGVTEIIWHRNGFITEGTQTNVCFIKNNELITPPLSNFILPGITRGIVLRLCKKLGITTTERDIKLSELNGFDEILLLSTTAEVIPVIEADGKIINNRIPGPVCRLLQGEYQKLYNAESR
ncbi:MAG: D-amino-acid transaminase [Melioribacter sp.]|nr:D-amino-acid transaminase [Melioribacter sp.]